MNDVDRPLCYEIRVARRLSPAVAGRFPELTAQPAGDGGTLLCGPLPDQAALFGVLLRIRDLGLTLQAVNVVIRESENQSCPPC